jgi:hypothetical protein
MDATTADRIWDVLVRDAGATERDRTTFVRYLTTNDTLGSWEYRFMGTLAFGGKLHYSRYRGAYVTCYPDDLTDERQDTITRVNVLLRQIAPKEPRCVL